ncbi:MAG TPA: prolipoprotein diacylglyceryl transferase [Burkholderiaceae bacterium]|nr:prolipoprotein diacylglyceryl transferase [Burkholderiaceae bacterium]
MSFPYLSDVIKAITGYDVPLPIPMFGICVAVAMLVASNYLRREMARLHAIGRLGTARIRMKSADMGAEVAYANVPPQNIVPDLTAIVMLAGIVGARLFHILEHSNEFLTDPWAMIWTRSGLSVFGGLIFGTLAGLICVSRWKLPIRPLLDAVAPAMMLGYALGRIGCQISGDGDWGLAANMALKPDWLPMWLWAQTYDNNIFGQLIAPPGVYPTPLYETFMGVTCFALLWIFRKHPFRAGWLFSIYLLLAGVERLFIEQIRVNPVLNIGGFHATQAELISIALIVLGLIGIALLSRRLPIASEPRANTTFA